jgi:hypothetical protein
MSIGLIIHVLIFALAFLTAAYLVYAAAQKSEGLLKSVGTILAAILAALGALVLIGHLSAPMTGGRPFGIDMGQGSATAPSSVAPSTGSAASGAAKPAGSDAGGSEGAAAPAEGETGGAKP